ncbi:MAG: hypothetical protein QM538_06260 [Methylacidiphilales bacterium]|nr:hypothetical protein [Candidatus Methylacidiphilales bacterium]
MKKSNRTLLYLICAVFTLPFISSFFVLRYYHNNPQSFDTKQHGVLVSGSVVVPTYKQNTTPFSLVLIQDKSCNEICAKTKAIVSRVIMRLEKQASLIQLLEVELKRDDAWQIELMGQLKKTQHSQTESSTESFLVLFDHQGLAVLVYPIVVPPKDLLDDLKSILKIYKK